MSNTIEAKGEPGLVRPLREAVEKTIKGQIDKAYKPQVPSETHQIVGKPDQMVEREDAITKISSVGFYRDVGRAVKEILEKRASKVPPQFLSEKGKTKDKPEKKGKEEGEEEEEEEEKPKKGKKKEMEEEDEEETGPAPMFAKGLAKKKK